MPDKSGSHFPKLVTVRQCYCRLLKSARCAILRKSEPKSRLTLAVSTSHFPHTFDCLSTRMPSERDIHFSLSLLKTKRTNWTRWIGLLSPVANAFQKHALQSVLVDDPFVHSCATLPCRVRCVKDCLDNVLFVFFICICYWDCLGDALFVFSFNCIQVYFWDSQLYIASTLFLLPGNVIVHHWTWQQSI